MVMFNHICDVGGFTIVHILTGVGLVAAIADALVCLPPNLYVRLIVTFSLQVCQRNPQPTCTICNMTYVTDIHTGGRVARPDPTRMNHQPHLLLTPTLISHGCKCRTLHYDGT